MTRPVVIVGGGLAGLGLGLALRRNAVPVTIHEAGRYPRHRVCGEFITSLDRHTREELGLDKHLLGARTARNVSWCEDGKPDITHRLPHPALCLSRHALDAAMAEEFVALGGELRTNSRAVLREEAGVVHAGGRQPDPKSVWTGVKQHYRSLPLRNDLEVHFGQGGYMGLTKIDPQTVNVCALLRRKKVDLTKAFPGIAKQSGFCSLAQRLAEAKPVEDSFCAMAGLNYGAGARRDDALRIGDQQCLVPPFTGHGMTIALQSAATALPHVLAWARGEIEWDEACAKSSNAQRRRFGFRLRVARAAHPLLLDPRPRSVARGLHRLGVLPVRLLYRMM
ncbi:MAG: NAD(P)/FAD-dependent oxidoreductase, partial [Chthoniobacterales bacterium]